MRALGVVLGCPGDVLEGLGGVLGGLGGVLGGLGGVLRESWRSLGVGFVPNPFWN